MRRPKGPNISQIHGPCLYRYFRAQHRQGAGPDHRVAGGDIARPHTAMAQLDCGQRPMPFDRRYLGCMTRDITIIPNPFHRVVGHISVRADLGDLHRNRAPAPLGLHST